MVNTSLFFGANIHADDDMALRLAVYRGHQETVQSLLDHGANVHAADDQALFWAANKGYDEIVRTLLDHGADIHAQHDFVLFGPATHGKIKTVQYLLSRGATPSGCGGSVMIHIAEEDGRSDIADLLRKEFPVDNCKLKNAKAKDGNTTQSL